MPKASRLGSCRFEKVNMNQNSATTPATEASAALVSQFGSRSMGAVRLYLGCR